MAEKRVKQWSNAAEQRSNRGQTAVKQGSESAAETWQDRWPSNDQMAAEPRPWRRRVDGSIRMLTHT